MADICVDENNPISNNRINLGLNEDFASAYKSSVKDNGEYTLGILDFFETNFLENSVYENLDIITQMKTEYGDQEFFDGLSDINVFLQTTEISEESYPVLTDRIDRDVLFTPIEYALFISEYGYSPTSLNNDTVDKTPSVLKQLNSFYGESFTKSKISSFCELVPSIFTFNSTFFTDVSSITARINDAVDFIRNSTFEDLVVKATMTLLISQLKDQSLEVFEQSLEKARNIVDNFKAGNVLGTVETFVNPNIIRRIYELKSAAERFFNPQNIELLKKNIQGLIDYAVNLFKDPSLDTIQFLVYRFCSLASEIEAGISSVYKPLTDFSSRYNSSFKTIQATSNENTGRALRAGAIRYAPEIKRNEINTSRDRVTAEGNTPPIQTEEVDTVTQYNNAKGDSRIGFQGGWVSAVGEEGWTRVSIDVKILLMRLQERFGKRLIVNSAYRPPWYNKKVDGAKSSKHMQGIALDITWGGISISEREEFIRLAREIGFKGIGRYGTRFVHIDVGPERSWGS